MLATLRWGDSIVHVAPWSPGREPPPSWMSLAHGTHLTVHLEPLDESPPRALPRASFVLTLAGSLVAHALLLIAMSMALPRLAPSLDDRASPWSAIAWLSTPIVCSSHATPDDELPDVVTRATSPESPRSPHVAFDAPTEVTSSHLLGGEPGVAGHHAMPTERGLDALPGLRDVDRIRHVDPVERLRHASWHRVAPGETLSAIAARHDLTSYLALYNDRLNPELLRLRPDPDLIFPGDRVRLPFAPPAGGHERWGNQRAQLSPDKPQSGDNFATGIPSSSTDRQCP